MVSKRKTSAVKAIARACLSNDLHLVFKIINNNLTFRSLNKETKLAQLQELA